MEASSDPVQAAVAELLPEAAAVVSSTAAVTRPAPEARPGIPESFFREEASEPGQRGRGIPGVLFLSLGLVILGLIAFWLARGQDREGPRSAEPPGAVQTGAPRARGGYSGRSGALEPRTDQDTEAVADGRGRDEP